MKYIHKTFALLTLSGLIAACGDNSSSDPSTSTRDAFNPPGFAYTTTQEGKISIHFTTANVEDDFKGYHILGTLKDKASIKEIVKYPSLAGGDIGENSGIPRCKDNSALFQFFGFELSDDDCEGAGDSAAEESTTGTDEAATGETEEVEVFTNFLACEQATGENATKLSLPVASGKSLDVQTCTVSTIYNPETKKKEDISAHMGKAMTFAVVAVKGDDLDDISWSSNFVEDASSKTAYDADVTLKEDTYKTLDFAFADGDFTVTLGGETTCGNGPLSLCRVFKANAQTPALKVYLARDAGTPTHLQRIFVSTAAVAADSSATDYIKIRPRGSKTNNPLIDGVFDRIPGDEPAESYLAEGKTMAVYGNQVFDIEITTAGGTYYGKVVIKSVNYATADNKASDATLAVSVIVNNGNGIRHYVR